MIGAPRTWIDPFVVALRTRLEAAAVEGAISGPGWVSLRTDKGFLWMWTVRGARMAWLAERPLPRRWLELMGRHSRSPFAPHLREGRIAQVQALVDEKDSLDGLSVEITPGGRRLSVRFVPRPGAIWLVDDGGAELARLGRMEGAVLQPRTPEDPPLDLVEHAEACVEGLASELLDHTATRLRQQVAQTEKKLQRRVWTLEGDLDRARERIADRQRADLLAAHLHEITAGQSSFEITDFEGNPVEIELDPALAPHANLDRWYKRAAKAERSVEQIASRLGETRQELATVLERVEQVEVLPTDSIESLDAWLDFAHEHGLDPKPRDTTASAQKRRVEERLPYWTYRSGDWEVRVGRSASDNDELTFRHSHLRDVWLHAQGASGSHVVIRSAGRPVPRQVIEEAACIAAHYSKAKTSGTVAVHVTERRYVRKGRKMPPGTVKFDRAETVFVEPRIPEGWAQD